MSSDYACPPEFNQSENLRKLFVSGIPKDISDDELKEFFSAYGEIESAFLNRKGSETKSKLFGFVTFVHCDDVDECLMQKPIKFKGFLLDAKRAVPKDYTGENSQLRVKQLYVSNVTPKLTEQELREYLEKRHPPRFGAIGDIILKKRVGEDGRATSENRGFGFITVSSEDLADRIAFGDAQFNIGGMSRPQMIVKATPREEGSVPGAGGGGGMPMRGRGRGERGHPRGMDRGGMRDAPLRGGRGGRGFSRGGDVVGRGFGRGMPRGADRGVPRGAERGARGNRGFTRGAERGGRGFSRGGGYSDGGYGQSYEEDYSAGYRDREGYDSYNDGGKDNFRNENYADDYGANTSGGFRDDSFTTDYGQSYGASDTRDPYRSGSETYTAQVEESFTTSSFKEDYSGGYNKDFAAKDTYAGYDDPYARDSAAAQSYAQETAAPQAGGGFSRGMSAPARGPPAGAQRSRGRGRGAPRGAGYVSY